MRFRSLTLAVSVLLLISPFLILFSRFSTWSMLPAARLLDVFGFTAWQAFLSASVSVVLGTIGGFGLLASSSGRAASRLSRTGLARTLALLPSAVPSLLVILATMSVWPSVRGLGGIVAIHALLNIGPVALSVASLLTNRVSSLADLSYIEGASRWFFLRRGVLPLLAPDLARLFLFVFSICFSSFAVPLIVGGSRATTVEVLIYEQIRVSPDWSVALGLAALQTLAIFVLAAFVGSKTRPRASVAFRVSPLLQWWPGLLVVLLPSAIVALGLLARLPQGVARLDAAQAFADDLPRLVAGSFFTAILTGVLCAGLLLLLMVARPEGFARRFILGFVAPSSALTGFALLFLWSEVGWASLVKIALGLTLVFVPSFYRLRWDGALAELAGQVTVARTLGASEARIVWHICLPQLWGTCMFLAGLGAFWAWGDFALSAVVGERALTLAMLAHGLLGSYRLDLATVVVCCILIGGLFTFGLFWGAGRVLGTRAES